MEKTGFQLAFSRSFMIMLASTAIPVAVQVILASSRSLADIMMTANLGEDQLAAMGITGRIIFVVLMAMFGMINGGSVIIAQLWGAKKVEQTKQATAHTLLLAFPIALVCTIFCFIFAQTLVSTASNDPMVIEYGTTYIRWAIFSMLPLVISMTFSSALRCLGQAKIGMLFTVLGVSLNLVLNYLLIFGHGGFDAMGVKGAAIATLISAFFEAAIVLFYIYGRGHFLALTAIDIRLGFKNGIYKKIFKIGVPLSINSIIWAFGIYMYTFLVGLMGTQSLAVLAIITPMESIIMSFYIGISSAAAVIAGNSLGAGQFKLVWLQAKALIIWSLIAGLCMSALILLSRHWILGFFDGQSSETLNSANDVLLMLAIVGTFRSLNITIIVGLLRAGGDQKFVLAMDIFCQWAVGILLTYLCIQYWQLSLFWVFLAINSEEIIKAWICTWRLMNKSWIVNLVQDDSSAEGDGLQGAKL